MNREHFLERLSELLAKVPEAERGEMLQYYRDYFEDAGAENEAEVLRTLGSPEAVAQGLLRDLGETPVTTASPADRAVVEYGKIIREEPAFPPVSVEEPSEQSNREVPERTANRLSGGMLVLTIILLLFALPIMIPLALAAVAIVCALIVAWLALCLVSLCVTAALFVAMIALIVTGVGCMFISPAVGACVFGAGLVVGGIGFLSLIVTVLLTGAATPAIFRGVGRLFRHGRKD
ncbi:MAG: DUF1700 domain-containing protein [Acetatifactor sp.]